MSSARHNNMWLVTITEMHMGNNETYYFVSRAKAIITAKRLLLEILQKNSEDISVEDIGRYIREFEQQANVADPEQDFVYDIDGHGEIVTYIEVITFSDHLV